MLYKDIKATVEKELSLKRFYHTLDVEGTAVKIFHKYKKIGLEFEFKDYDLKLAAILHDVTKEKNHEEQKKIIEQYSNEETKLLLNEENKNIWHAFTGAILAKEKYEIKNEEVINAIKYHTTGYAGLSELGKIIYIADFVEPGRRKEQANLIKLMPEKSIDEMCLLIAMQVKENLIKKNKYCEKSLNEEFIKYLEKEITQ